MSAVGFNRQLKESQLWSQVVNTIGTEKKELNKTEMAVLRDVIKNNQWTYMTSSIEKYQSKVVVDISKELRSKKVNNDRIDSIKKIIKKYFSKAQNKIGKHHRIGGKFSPAKVRLTIQKLGERVDRLVHELRKKGEVSNEELKIVEDSLSKATVMGKENFSAFKKAALETVSKDLESRGISANRRESILKSLENLIKIVHRYEHRALGELEKNNKLQEKYSNGEKIPEYVKDFDVKAKHPMNLKEYLDIRISRAASSGIKFVTAMKTNQGKNVEFFIGPSTDMLKYYASKGYYCYGELQSRSSTQFLYFENKDDSRDAKVVINGVVNHSKLNHILLQLKFSGVNLNKVQIRGEFKTYLSEIENTLANDLKQFKVKPELAFIGNRSLILIELAKRVNPKAMAVSKNPREDSEKILKDHELKTIDYGGIFKLSYVTATTNDGEKIGVVGMRMPNGDLSGVGTKHLIKSGVKTLVMVGAGGSFTEESGLGSYQVLNSSKYIDQEITIPESMKFDVFKEGDKNKDIKFNRSNITVDSPLVENHEWIEQSEKEKRTSVEVETFHIFKAVETANKPNDFKFLPGVFTSDVLGSHPLTEKIDPSNAWSKMPYFLGAIFDKLELAKPGEIKDSKSTLKHIQEQQKDVKVKKTKS